MSELSGALGGSAPKHEMYCNGKTYHVSLITQGVKVAFEKTLYRKARDTLADVRDITDREYYTSKMDALIDAYESGLFAMESEFGKKSMNTPRGSMLLLGLLMGEKKGDDIIPLPETEVISIVAQMPDHVANVLQVVMRESFPGVDIDKAIKEAEAQASSPQENPSPKARGPVDRPSS